jgi:small-conductance mechanosensitive channel
MPKKFKKIVDLSGNQIRKTNLKRKPKIGKSSAYTPKKKTPKKKNTKTNEIAIIKQEIETLKNEVNRVNATRQKAVEVPQEETIHIPTEQEDKML